MQHTMHGTTFSKKIETFHALPENRLGLSVKAGALTGEVAGLIMAGVLMAVYPLFLGHGPLYPVQIIGSAVYGEAALQNLAAGPILVGLLLHMLGPSLFWGVIYGFAASKIRIRNTADAVTLGGCIGVLSMIDVYLFVPMVMRAFHETNIWEREVPVFWDWAAHMTYGFSLGFFPSMFRKLSPVKN